MRALTTIFLLSLFVAVPVWGAGDGGGAPMSIDVPTRTPEEMAKADYNSGLRALKDAAKQEAALAAIQDEKKAAKTREKITKAYERALKSFVRAAQRQPTMHEAWNYIGYTQRHLGDYKSSLAAYAKALELKPNYPEAIEYRGEAFLGLNAIEDAKQAYLSLYRTSRPHADQLLTAMKTWVAKRRQNPEGVDIAIIDAFAKWIDERHAQASQNAAIDAGSAAPRW